MIIYKEKGTPFGIDIAEYKATLIDRLITPMTTIPNSFPPRPASKTYSLKFRLDGENEWEILKNVSRLTQIFQRCEMEFEDMTGYRTPG